MITPALKLPNGPRTAVRSGADTTDQTSTAAAPQYDGAMSDPTQVDALSDAAAAPARGPSTSRERHGWIREGIRERRRLRVVRTTLEERGLAVPSVDALERGVELFEALARYHRLEVRGVERIPEGPAILVGNHNAGLNPIDGTFLVAHYRRHGFHDPVFVLAHDVLFQVPRLARLFESVGVVRARPGNAQKILDAGHKLLVFPGGDIENLRPFSERKRVNLAGRTGFIRIAREMKVPLVPVVSAGAHESLLVVSQGRRLAKLLHLDELFRVHSVPLMLALPWGVMFGPTCALPYFPLPSKVTVEIGEAIDPFLDREGGPGELHHTYRAVEEAMQQMLTALYAERRLPVWG
jgi:1-acyl-sn-glycerol-3-phosphate acyltransferase